MINKIAIYGAGGLGKEVAALIADINKEKPTWELVGFYDDGITPAERVNGLPVLGGKEAIKGYKDFLVIAVGNPAIKKSIVEAIKDSAINYATLIHPKAILMNRDNISVGHGAIVTAGAVLTTDIKIGKHALINLNSTIGHDVEIGDFSSIMCGVNLGGTVTLKTGVFIGSGANVINNITIGEFSKIGAGAVVINDIKAHKTVIGVPAREK